MPLEQAYARFDPQPLAAASVAQVHRAWTREGKDVAVKVQRPGIERLFAADIRIIRRLARLADRFHLLGRLSATEMLDEFAAWTRREFDFVQEGEMAERVGEDPEPFEVEPKVYWELSTPHVLTLEFIDGVSLAQIVRIVEGEGADRLAALYPDIDVDLVLHHLTFASLRQIFVKGLFHGDPHPGNVLVLEDNRIAFVDFGIFGELSRYDREMLGRQIEQLALGNVDESLRAYAKQLTLTDESDPAAFRREARTVLRRWYDVSIRDGSPLEERHVGRYIGQMIDISRRHRLVYDMRYLLYWRALNALDSTALRLSQSFDLMAELRAFFTEVRPGAGRRIVAASRDLRKWTSVAALTGEAPGRVAALVGATAEGRHWWTTRPAESGDFCRTRHAEARRTAGAVVAAGLLFVAARAHVSDAARVAAALLGLPVALVSLALLRRT
jgi:ubiquinone biosynthesis protein